MKNLHFAQLISAPQNMVWEMMWSKKTFGIWMRPMGDGHYYEPTLFQGGYIRWLTPSGDGMFGKVLELIPNEKITFEHHGWISNGIDSQEDTFNSLEKYTLSASSDGTMVTIDVETFPEYEKLMMEKYPLVLAELNKIATAAFLSQNENR
jgi:uncharacterized protein YndB with AHSA1/START domain